MLGAIMPGRDDAQVAQAIEESVRKRSRDVDRNVKGRKNDYIFDSERVNVRGLDAGIDMLHLLVKMNTRSVTIDRQLEI